MPQESINWNRVKHLVNELAENCPNSADQLESTVALILHCLRQPGLQKLQLEAGPDNRWVVKSSMADPAVSAVPQRPDAGEEGDSGHWPKLPTLPKLTTLPADQTLWQVMQNAPGQILLPTSGTSGTAKPVRHDFASLTRQVKTDRPQDRWGLAYHPLSFAGLQVIFQALANQNLIVTLTDLPWPAVADRIRRHKLTHLSGTPTFFRMLTGAKPFRSIKRITVGGEPLQPRDTRSLNTLFPKAEIANLYASTELGVALRSDNDVFTIPDDRCDQFQVRDGHLFVQTDRLPAGHPRLDADGFFATGDPVEIVAENPLAFRFLARDQGAVINVGGAKVDPRHVEAALEAIPAVKLAHVFGRASSVVGEIVVAEVVLDSGYDGCNFEEIRQQVERYLQDYEIPRMIHCVAQLSLTPTGKRRINTS